MNDNDIEKLKRITPQEFALLGMQEMAYIKRVAGTDGVVGFAVHAADGTQVALLPDREVAFATVRRHELEPLSVH
ncbi:MAG TPA: DUF1150 family protein [Stellaceae bacterium]|nr:DUF1150 family protein [Stellaceae bacterium]